VVEGNVEEVTRKKVVEVKKKTKKRKAVGLSKMIMASGKVGEDVIMQLRLRALDGKGIQDECKNSVVVAIFKGKGDVMSCGLYRAKLLENGMKIVERVLESGEENTYDHW